MLFILAGNGLRRFAAYSADSFLTAVTFSSSASEQPFRHSPPCSSFRGQPEEENTMVSQSGRPMGKEFSTVVLEVKL